MTVPERTPKETGREYAMRTLRQNIITLELEPGSTVSENQLAAELGLSRTPVREALIALGKTQIVDILPQVGSRISLIDMELVEEAFFFRVVLEKAVAELACHAVALPHSAQLEENIRLQEFYLEAPNTDKLMELDDTFHSILFAACRKERIYQLMKSMTTHSDRLRHLTLQTLKNTDIVTDHRTIWHAIQERDTTAAVRAMEQHLMRYKYDETSVRQKHPMYFK